MAWRLDVRDWSLSTMRIFLFVVLVFILLNYSSNIDIRHLSKISLCGSSHAALYGAVSLVLVFLPFLA